ncbi:MAG TPA: amidohydrolase family protein [Vicinamibacterales bacterium]|nr:amidohydrolase family protein [Vicinamibacterales bacterium]
MRQRAAAVGFLAAAVAALSAQSASRPIALQAGDIVIAGGQLFDSVRDTVAPNTGIVVRNGVLLEVGATLDGRDLSQAQVVRLGADEYVLPGLFDLHAHYAVDLFGAGRVDEYTANPLIFLGNGVTSTFPAGEVDPEGMMAARRRIERGEQIGPRILSSGPYFGSARPGWKAAEETPERIRKEVDEWAARGALGFKAKGIQPPQLFALIDEAHRYGLTVTGHLDSGFRNSVNPRDAIEMGIDRIEHFMGGDAIVGTAGAYTSLEALDVTRPEVDAIIQLYLKRHVYFDATLSTYGAWYADKDTRVYTPWTDEMAMLTPHAREVVEAALETRRSNEQFHRIYDVKLKEIKRFYDAGGAALITSGTDMPSWGEFFSGFATHRELNAFVVAGIPPAAAIKMATINAAHAFGMSDRLGTIEAGKLADLCVIRGNPLDDIRHTHDVLRVMSRGKLFDAKALLNQARGTLGPKTAEDDAWWKGNSRFAGGGSGQR